MNCLCIANDKFNFIIEYKKDHLVFVDKSEWTNHIGNTQTVYPIKIINQNSFKILNIKVGGSTIINYCDLPSESEGGSDGIYTFEIESCGDVYSRAEAVLPHIMCSYSKLLIKYDPESYKDKVWNVFREIEFIKVNANICNVTEATKHYDIVKKMFEHINCKC